MEDPMKYYFLFSLLLIPHSVSATEPFGIAKGIPLGVLDFSIESKGPTTVLSSVPKPHNLFEIYAVRSSAKTGVCAVIAATKDYENDRYGSDVRSDFERLSKSLSAKYGQKETFDFIKSSALWDDDDEWVMSLMQNERYLVSEWAKDDKANQISSIEMAVKANSSDSSYITLRYNFDNHAECLKVIESKEDSTL